MTLSGFDFAESAFWKLDRVFPENHPFITIDDEERATRFDTWSGFIIVKRALKERR